MPRQVIVNADDFGLSACENAVIVGAFQAGVITSATAMANMPAFEAACVMARHPMLEGRIGPGWDQLGARTSDEDLSLVLKRLKKRPLDYFKHSFYADTAVFGGVPATHAGFAFYDLDKIVFASDCPFDPEKGTMYTRETLRIIEGIDMPAADKEKVWHGNLERITGVKFKS